MKNIRIVPLLSLATIALAGALAAVVVTMPVAPAFADTPGVSPTCFPQTQNPHPTAPVAQTTDTLFCSPQSPNSAGSGTSGTGTGGSGTGGSGSTGSGTHAGGQTGSGTTTAGTTSGGGSSSLTDGSKGSVAKSTPSPSTGFFGGLVAFLGAAGGLVFLFGFLILLALVLLAVGIIGWLRRRSGEGWGSRFARVTHRA